MSKSIAPLNFIKNTKTGCRSLFALACFAASSSLGCAESLPQFESQGIVLDYKNLKYNPANDLIFPSVIETGDLEDALGKYYMYYAPHNAPGGICLAYADRPEGPWTEYEKNPVVQKSWEPHYKVSHVSSPHALWIEKEQQLFLWFHGENNTTRYASSADGIHFKYEGVAITTNDLAPGSQVSEASYARVFEDPSPKREGYVMLFMGNQRGQRKIFMSRSEDARHWDVAELLFAAPDSKAPQTSGAWLWAGEGHTHVLAHAPFSDGHYAIYAMETDPELSEFRYLGKVLEGTDDAPRVAAPALVETNGKTYLFHQTGRRTHSKIGLAVLRDQ